MDSKGGGQFLISAADSAPQRQRDWCQTEGKKIEDSGNAARCKSSNSQPDATK